MWLVPTLLYLNRFPAEHRQHRQEETVYLPWTPTQILTFRTVLQLILFVEEGELSDDLEATGNDPDLAPSEEQTYRETMSGIRSFMGWSHIPEMDTTASRSEDNPFAGPKAHPTGKGLSHHAHG